MDLGQTSWAAAVLVAVIAAVLLALSGYYGYSALSLAIGASAAINLRR